MGALAQDGAHRCQHHTQGKHTGAVRQPLQLLQKRVCTANSHRVERRDDLHRKDEQDQKYRQPLNGMVEHPEADGQIFSFHCQPSVP